VPGHDGWAAYQAKKYFRIAAPETYSISPVGYASRTVINIFRWRIRSQKGTRCVPYCTFSRLPRRAPELTTVGWVERSDSLEHEVKPIVYGNDGFHYSLSQSLYTTKSRHQQPQAALD